MIYLQKSRQPKKKFFLFSIITAVLVIALIFLLQIFAGRTVERLALSTGGPVASVYTSFQNQFSFLSAFAGSRSNLIKKNNQLQTDLDNLQAKLLRYDSLYKEHQDLLAAYGRSSTTGPVVLGNVIAKPPQSPYDVLIADVGSKDGVVMDASVYGLGGLPIGKVGEVTSSTSKLIMFSSVNEENQGVLERTGATVSLKGTGGGNMESEMSQDADVVVGDTVLLPQFNGAIIASVIEIESSKTSASKRVLFHSPVNIFNLRFVEIGKVSK